MPQCFLKLHVPLCCGLLLNDYGLINSTQHYIHRAGESIRHNDAFVRFDLAMHAKAKQIQWSPWGEFKDTVIRPGGPHCSNFLRPSWKEV